MTIGELGRAREMLGQIEQEISNRDTRIKTLEEEVKKFVEVANKSAIERDEAVEVTGRTLARLAELEEAVELKEEALALSFEKRIEKRIDTLLDEFCKKIEATPEGYFRNRVADLEAEVASLKAASLKQDVK